MHPEARGTLMQLGHDPADFDRVFAQVKAGAMLAKAWATVATEAESWAAHYERDGFDRTASDLYLRARVIVGSGVRDEAGI